MPKSVMKRTCASDYIAIKRQSAIFTGDNINNMNIQSDKKCCSETPPKTVCNVRTSTSYELLNDYYSGQKYNKEVCK
jgi:hypothetical protein